MPLPRLDDDQKYWEERCHELEREVERLKGFIENSVCAEKTIADEAREKCLDEVFAAVDRMRYDVTEDPVEKALGVICALKQKEGNDAKI